MNGLDEERLGHLLCGYVATADEPLFVLAEHDTGLEEARIVYANAAFLEALGRDGGRVVGQPLGVLFSDEGQATALERFWRLHKAEVAVRAEVQFADGDGAALRGEMTLRSLTRGDSMPHHWLGALRVFGDGTLVGIQDADRTRSLLARLPTATLFEDRLHFALTHARRMKQVLALLFVDIDRGGFGDGIDAESVDYLRQSAALRLAMAFREGDSLAQLGAGRFAMLSLVNRALDGARLGEKVIEILSAPFRVGDREVTLQPAVGIAVAPDDGEAVLDLLEAADAAAVAAAAASGAGFRFHAVALQTAMGERRTVEESLRDALDRGEFRLYYQPLVEATTGRVVAMEALLRWHHPQQGLLAAEQFLPTMQESGLILPIGEWVLRTACGDARRWHDAGHRRVQVAVNLSLQEFRRPDLRDLVSSVLAGSGLQPEHLQIELPDTVAAGEIERSQEILQRLHDLGVRLSIDISTDNYSFGVVPASALKRLPVHRVKIGRATVGDLDTDTGRAAVAEAAIAMAHSLNIEAVANGVETRGEVGGLRKRHIDVVQGYLVSRPLPASEIEGLLAREHLL